MRRTSSGSGHHGHHRRSLLRPPTSGSRALQRCYSTRPPQGRNSAGSVSEGDVGAVLMPPDILDFVGREHELRAISRVLGPPRGPLGRAAVVLGALIPHRATFRQEYPSAPAVVAISGMAGVGKSALAVHAAHLAGDRFPDALLYTNLRAADGHPHDGANVLATFLRALVPKSHDDGIPDDAAAREQRSRSLLSRRRALIVLDNAQSAAQVHPLLGVGPACAIIITSRRPLSALEGAYSIDLSGLPEPRALELLIHLAGIERIRTEVAAATDIAALCGRLPLALRVVGATLARRDYWSLAHEAERLADERKRLSQLQDKNAAVDASVSLSYAELQATVPAAARLFRLLSVLAGQ